MSQNALNTLRERVIKIAKVLKYNEVEFAYMAHIDDIELVSKILKREAYPTRTMLTNIVKYLGINEAWLVSPYTRIISVLQGSSLEMFQKSPISSKFEEEKYYALNFSYSCLKYNLNLLLVVEDFEKIEEPRVMGIMKQDDFYEIGIVFDFFDLDTILTRDALKQLLELYENQYSNKNIFTFANITVLDNSRDFTLLRSPDIHIGAKLQDFRIGIDNGAKINAYFNAIFDEFYKDTRDEILSGASEELRAKLQTIIEYVDKLKDARLERCKALKLF
ncbi:hypothetical protein OFO01_06995 [Campylobacter sp. JMF_01 NE2]|uniref:hypothetical protein n=1 Tax=unclassified Campylobacter TaxID=2593542 RepID=UPI0022E9B0E2|nr:MULTISPECIES: hypothetical protein [unclassified Campylobacter]MDA3053291.1 hypothetical protein [Campylobacter sp. JMF_03 NE3]MDA3067526.1 hypothetical protein [Campylobacter sp. JMF_01 NE2]